MKDGQLRTFSYKLVNYLIQGSAADQTKQAMLGYLNKTKHGHIVLAVHDELLVECPIGMAEQESELLGKAMNSSFQEKLEYTIISTSAQGYNFGEV
jgi:DNA polymerase-1